MSMQPAALPPVPNDTARIAKAAFKKGNVYLTIGDHIGPVFADVDVSALYASDGAPAVSPTRLALVCIFQFMEDLGDRAAADAVRSRIDWKYALHLPLDDAGFDHSVLSDFRERLVQHELGESLFRCVLARLVEMNLLRKGGQQRTDATHVLMVGRVLSRVELLGETLRLALEAVADTYPDWLRQIALPHWYERYQRPLTSFRLPRGQAEREALALDIAADGFHLLNALATPDAPPSLSSIEEIKRLRQVWGQQLVRSATGVEWRPSASSPPTHELIASPHDPQARYRRQDEKVWTGYAVHLTESCDAEQPHFITQVETTPATTADVHVVADIQAELAQADVLPTEHYVDANYISAPNIVASRDRHQVTLLGPIRADVAWQAQHPHGIPLERFVVERDQQRAVCPAGKTSVRWFESPTADGRTEVQVRFAKTDCEACSLRVGCTTATRTGRTLTISPDYETIQAARQHQTSQAFRDAYKVRAGIEGTISAGVRRQGLRRSRYAGLDKTHLQHVFSAMAINFHRAARWLMGDKPKGTRPPRLRCLASDAVAA